MTNRSSAARYAKALFDVSRQEGDPQAEDRDLAAFVTLATGNPELARALVNAAIPAARKAALVGEILARMSVGPIVRKLIVLLAERDRLVLLPDLLVAYRRRLMDFLNIVQAEVTSAVPLPPEAAQAIERAIAERTHRTVALTFRVDQSIIGGVVTRIGSLVYDGSVKRQLEKMKETLTSAA
ncbi:MAG TPA: ATP synthase F1 subunit delta [Vicinamibacterales bacterium]